MKRRLVVIMVLLVVLPLVLLGWLGSRLATAEQQSVERQFEALLGQRLEGWSYQVAQLFAEQERALGEELADAPYWSTEQHDEFIRNHPLVRQTFVLGGQAELHHPRGPFLTPRERDFVQRLSGLVASHSYLFDNQIHSVENAGTRRPSGWSTWYERSGIELIYFSRLDNGVVYGAEIDRVMLLAELIAMLPDTNADSDDTLVHLVDENDQLIYQWGRYEPEEGALPAVEIALEQPLTSWKLQYYAPPTAAALGTAARYGIFGGLIAAAIALLGLVIYLHREYAREMREAEQRVNFVSQVSHELKTPLTSIRMYAELLNDEIDDTDETSHRHLGIIVNESQRLTRLIENVLTFGKDARGGIKLRPVETNPDELVAQLAEQFAPSLREKGLQIETELNAGQAIVCDPDVLRQILGNLLSNAEKYAVEGKLVRLETEQNGHGTIFRVIDRGPGIPASAREKIFRPFYRLDSSLTSGAAGAGIGLAIARNLARLHGGDLRLAKWNDGCTFELTLPKGKPE